MLPPHRQRGEVLGFQPARQPGQKRETLFTAAGLLCLYDGEEREGDTSGGGAPAGQVMLHHIRARLCPATGTMLFFNLLFIPG